MQRLEIVWRYDILMGQRAPLTDAASYWEIHVKVCDDEHYYEVVGYGEGGEAQSEHVVPYSLVRSVSARPIDQQALEAATKENAE